MFEKEAEKWVRENTHTEHSASFGEVKVEPSAEKGFVAGAEFGYNKANEWHYPSKGELPKEDTAEKETIYLLCFGSDDSDCMTGVFSHSRFWCFDSGWLETNEVIAWKEIVLPELKES